MAVYTTINDPSAYFTTTLYTGNAVDNRAITNSANAGNFQPDLLWYKERSSTSSHRIFDSSRGASKRIEPDVNAVEATDTSNHKSFDTNGYTIGTSGSTNADGDTYVAWQWKANGGTTASNSNGAITTTVQANTTAGFSIVTLTLNNTSPTTFGHGLGSKPQVMLIKNRDNTNNWDVFHQSANSGVAEDGRLQLNTTAAFQNTDGVFNDTAPTSTVATIKSSWWTGGTDKLVAYCFTGVQGYSQFGNFVGNANADGPYVYLGFKPAWVMIKRSDSDPSWIIWDSKRPGYNGTGHRLYADANAAEDTGAEDSMDILATGFKIRGTSNSSNASGGNFIYMAFAHSPFVTSTGLPCTSY